MNDQAGVPPITCFSVSFWILCFSGHAMNHGARRGLERGSCRFNLMAWLLNGHQKLVLNHVFSELCLVALVEACDVALAATQFHELLAEMDDTNGESSPTTLHTSSD
jgi:hypothetical protein